MDEKVERIDCCDIAYYFKGMPLLRMNEEGRSQIYYQLQEYRVCGEFRQYDKQTGKFCEGRWRILKEGL